MNSTNSVNTLNPRTCSRRALLKGAASIGVLGAAGGSLLGAKPEAPTSLLKKGTVILFQGDSITDAGRDKKNQIANDVRALGRGYPAIAAGELLGKYAGLELKIHNRGISGNKVPDLAARWQKDAIDIKPDILSILIGVNDMWHKLMGRYKGTVEDYETGYRDLLRQTLKALPGVHIVICEPFLLRTGKEWFPEFDQRRAVAKKLADEMKLPFVPFQAMFNKAIKAAPRTFWAGDGVHPTLAGHALMVQAWREVVGI